MNRRALVTLLAGALCASAAIPSIAQSTAPKADYANGFDQALAGVFEAREKDWRDGAVVYQVHVDRFAPPADLQVKRALYPTPKKLHPWTDLPTRGVYLPDAKVWSHEIDFWGGDLQSLRGKLDYIQGLGADVLYLNPIDLAYTNHKYDTLDYRAVSPEYGTRDDARALARIVQDADYEHILKSWVYLDNHDTPRLASALPDTKQRRLAQVLQFTLPGSPDLYYGTELDMPGGDDPEMRAPMRWDLVKADNPVLNWSRRLIALHKDNRALRVGNYRAITASKFIGFERYTERAADTIVVLLNPSDTPVTDTVLVANSKLMEGSRMVNLLADPNDPATPADTRLFAALMHLTLPAHGFAVLKPDVAPPGGYTNYKRVQ